MKKFIIFIIFNLLFINITNVQAATFSNASYENAQDYHILATKVLTESTKQSFLFFSMAADWDTYNRTTNEKYKDMENYIQDAKERFSFVKEYNTPLAKEISQAYDDYVYYLNNQLEKDVSELSKGYVIFIDFIESNLAETQTNYLSFKKDGLNKFLNEQIYITSNRTNISKVMNGNEEDKKDGIEGLKITINNLKNIENNKSTPIVIKNYAKVYENYYNNIINGNFVSCESLLSVELDRIDGLRPVADAMYEMNEYNNYVNIFNNFSEYPTLELSKKLSAKKIKEQLELVINQSPTSKNVQELKKIHYEFLYQLSQNSDSVNVDKLYNSFYNKYLYLENYYYLINQRYNGFKTSQILTEINLLKEQSKCLNSNIDIISNLSYSPPSIKDTNSYREFKINYNSTQLKKYAFVSIIFIIGIGCVFVFSKKIYNSYKDEKDDDNYYDDY